MCKIKGCKINKNEIEELINKIELTFKKKFPNENSIPINLDKMNITKINNLLSLNNLVTYFFFPTKNKNLISNKTLPTAKRK